MSRTKEAILRTPPTELLTTWGDAAGTTALFGLANAAFHGRKLWKLQKQYDNRLYALEAGGNPPDTPALPASRGPRGPYNGGDPFGWGEHTDEQAANMLERYNSAIIKRDFQAISNNFSPQDSFEEIRRAVAQGNINPYDAKAMIIEGGINPNIADTVIYEPPIDATNWCPNSKAPTDTQLPTSSTALNSGQPSPQTAYTNYNSDKAAANSSSSCCPTD